MSLHRTARQGLALVLAALPLTACGSSLGAKEAQPASRSVAANATSAGDECGTAERPCILQEIRVTGAAD